MRPATKTAEEAYKDYGDDLSERTTHVVRLCRRCADRSGARVYSLRTIIAGEPVRPSAVQPEGEEGDR